MELKHHANLTIYKLQQLSIVVALLLRELKSLVHPDIGIRLSLFLEYCECLRRLESLTHLSPDPFDRLEHLRVVLGEVELLDKLSEFIEKRFKRGLTRQVTLQGSESSAIFNLKDVP